MIRSSFEIILCNNAIRLTLTILILYIIKKYAVMFCPIALATVLFSSNAVIC